MKFIIVFVALFAIAMAEEVDIVRRDFDVQPDGFKFSSETSDGNKHDAEGHLVNPGAEDEEIVVRGSYSFVADDGQTYTVNYVADRNGFQPQGAHLPVAPQA
ncbi:larval cuticle protein 65Ag1-like [Cochliomyia hominivorax]